jgi:hypothetical protein
MVDGEINSVATAIRGAEFEGFIASTLFSQGWSVTFRALDAQSLCDFLDSNEKQVSLLLISSDLEGLTQQSLESIQSRGIKYFLFAATASAGDEFPDAVSQPTTSLELMGLIRGSLRTPMIRSTQREKIRARTIAIASPAASVGCTTLTVNLGAELAQLGKKVLIVDAHAYFPAFAQRLGVRGLNSTSEFYSISPGLWALEVTHSEISSVISSLDRARVEFDFILIDQGTIRDFPAILTCRRWCNETFIWISNHADELWIMSRQEDLATERLKALTSELARNTIKPQLSFIQIQSTLVKRKKSEADPFLAIVTPLRPVRIVQYPWDPRNVLSAEEERITLLESNERGSLRKSIEHLAGELVS